MVILKLVRRGRRHLALYDIIAANKRAKCDGKCIEKLGTYNPMKETSDVVLYEDKIIEHRCTQNPLTFSQHAKNRRAKSAKTSSL